MAAEGAVETPVDQNAGGAADNGSGNKGAGDPNTGGQPTPKSPVTPDAAGKSRDYDREIAGFKADLAKERKARQQYEQRVAKYEADLAAERKRVQALAGVATPSATEEEDQKIKARFEQLYPWASGLTKEDIDAIRELKTKKAEIDETTQHYWSQHSQKMVEGVQAEIEKELGGKLNAAQKQQVEQLYALRANSDTEFLERHSNGDRTLITEFAKQFVDNWFEPARRKVTQQSVERFRTVPSGKDRGIVTHGEKKIDVTDDKAVADFLAKGYRERNGDFGRR